MPVPRVAQVGGPGQNGPEQWFRSLPIITQCWFGLALLTTLSGNLGFVSPRSLIFSLDAIKESFQVWRVLTCFCYVGPFEFNTLIGLYLLLSFSKQYEKGGPYNTGAGGGTADYAFALIFGMISMIVTGPLVRQYLFPVFPLYTRNLIFFVLYIWSKRNPTAQANIWGVPIPANLMPFAYLALTVFLGAPIYDQLHGIGVGHVYYFLVHVVPTVYGKDVLSTPQFLIDYFGVGEYVAPLADNPVPQQQNANPNEPRGGGGGHNWGGGGRALGDR